MLVDGDGLDVAPSADRLLEAAARRADRRVRQRRIAWNNELALHVIELKCNGPRPSLTGLGNAFAANVALANDTLGRDGLRLLPTAMPPWIDPSSVLPLAAWHARRLRHVRPDLLVQGSRVGKPPEHADQPAVPRRRGIRTAPRGDPLSVADPAGPGRELAHRRWRAQRSPRQPARRLPQQLCAAPRR